MKLHAAHKAKVYRKTDACLFVESDDRQAGEIADLSGRPVLSIEGQRIAWPSQRTDAARQRFRREKAGPVAEVRGLRQDFQRLVRNSPAAMALVRRLRSLRV